MSGDRSEQQQQQESCLLPVTAPVQYWAAESGITCYFVTVELDVTATEHHSTTDSLLLQQPVVAAAPRAPPNAAGPTCRALHHHSFKRIMPLIRLLK